MSTGRRCRDCGAAVAGRRWKCDDCKGLGRGPRKPSPTVSRERDALRLRATGLTFDKIAEQLGYADESGAWRAYRRAMKRSGSEHMSLADRRELELHRLDLALAAIWDQVEKGDLGAIDRYERLAKLRVKIEGMAVAARRSGWDDDEHGDDAGGDGNVVGPDRLDKLRQKRERDAAERAGS